MSRKPKVRLALDQERLRRLLTYDARTGEFTRLVGIPRSNVAVAGAKPGRIRSSGYVTFSVDGVKYGAHRLAWFYTYGYWPKELDHIDGNRANNRLSNLRECTRSENNQNHRKLRSDNTSGVRGVSWDGLRGLWGARITLDGKTTQIGRFLNFDDAVSARIDAELRIFPFQASMCT